MQILSNLAMVATLEDLPQYLYFYISSSPKWHLEFTKLVEIVKTRGLKILKNVKGKCILQCPFFCVITFFFWPFNYMMFLSQYFFFNFEKRDSHNWFILL
jgi:hypothetical protein